MDRSILYAQELFRSYDPLSNLRRALQSEGNLTNDLLGSAATVVSGFTATPTGPTSLTINIAAGRVYQQFVTDASAFGTLPSDPTVITQQGYAAAQQVTLSTSEISAGQSQYALVQATFNQVDAIPSSDPTGGVLNFYNSANPQVPLVGPGGSGSTLNTVRQGLAIISVIYGAAAATGTEAPPSPSPNNVPLYLVDLVFGQTAISSGQILVAGPSVGTNVPSNYQRAPFLAGLLGSHHNGHAGQAPQINLATEVQGKLPLANMPASSANSGAGIAAVYGFGGNPNSHVAGVAAVTGVTPPDFCIDTTTGNLWVCTTTGNAASAVWSQPNPTQISYDVAWGGTSTGTNTITGTTTPVFASLVAGQVVTFLVGNTNTAGSTANWNLTGAQTIVKRTPGGLANLTGGELVAGEQATLQYDGSRWQLISTVVGAAGYLNIGTGLQNDGSGNLAVVYGATAGTSAQGNDSRILNAVPNTTQVIAGTGLTGGGALSGNVTLNVAYGTSGTTAAAGNDSRIVNAVPNTTTVTGSGGLTGGGALSSNQTISPTYGTTTNTVAQGSSLPTTYRSGFGGISAGSTYGAFSHGLGALPDVVVVQLTCAVASSDGYTNGQTIFLNTGNMPWASSVYQGVTAVITTSTVAINISSSGIAQMSGTTGGTENVLTLANWDMQVIAIRNHS